MDPFPQSMEKSKWECNQRLRDSRDGANLSFERDRAYGFSWPQRNYRCSFCNKEFKSAQALGGHMNVHRRDRARMRLSPSWDSSPNPNPNPSPNPNPNPSPNPNPNPSLSLSSWSSQLPSTARFLPCNVACLNSVIKSPSPPSMQEDEFAAITRSPPRKSMALCKEGLGKKKNEGAMVEFTNFSRRGDVIRLDLSLGLIQDVKEDLDLELRLGCS